MTGGEAAITLHLKLATPPSCTIQLCGLRTNLGMASRRSTNKSKSISIEIMPNKTAITYFNNIIKETISVKMVKGMVKGIPTKVGVENLVLLRSVFPQRTEVSHTTNSRHGGWPVRLKEKYNILQSTDDVKINKI